MDELSMGDVVALINALTVKGYKKQVIDQMLSLKADLVSGKVPLAQLPSAFVTEVVEVNTYEDLPAEGDSSKTYYVIATQKSYRWLANANRYLEITQSANYTAVVVDAGITLEELAEIINAINTNGEHVFFDMHYYLQNGYICTIFLTETLLEINNVIGGSYYAPASPISDWTVTLEEFLENAIEIVYKHSAPKIYYH